MKKILIMLIFLVSCSTTDLTLAGLGTVSNNGVFTKNKMRVINKYYQKYFDTKFVGKENYIFNKRKLDGVTYYEYYNRKTNNILLMVHVGAFESPLSQSYITMMDNIFANSKGNFVSYIMDYTVDNKYPEQNIEVEKLVDDIMEKYDRVVIIGDSSGGNLVLTTMLKRRDEKKKMPDGLILLSPWTDLTNRVESRITRYYDDIVIGQNDYPDALLHNYYIKNEKDITKPYISPVYGVYNDFPRTLIQVGDHEVLLDDSKIIYEKMKKAGVDVRIDVYDRMFHVFQILPFLEESKQSYKIIGAFLDETFISD